MSRWVALVPTDDSQRPGGHSEVLMEVSFGTGSWTYESKVGYPTAAPAFTSSRRKQCHVPLGTPSPEVLVTFSCTPTCPGRVCAASTVSWLPFTPGMHHAFHPGAGLCVPRDHCHSFPPCLGRARTAGPSCPASAPSPLRAGGSSAQLRLPPTLPQAEASGRSS